jgi:RimJ/RimL family protein N-acetyltransferase
MDPSGSKSGVIWRMDRSAPPSFRAALARKAASEDPLYFAIVDQESGLPVGYAAYLRINPEHRVIEVGSLVYDAAFQRSTGATEAMYLMAWHAFELGYRRYEWKCNAENEASRRAALRQGRQRVALSALNEVGRDGQDRLE